MATRIQDLTRPALNILVSPENDEISKIEQNIATFKQKIVENPSQTPEQHAQRLSLIQQGYEAILKKLNPEDNRCVKYSALLCGVQQDAARCREISKINIYNVGDA